MGNGKLARCVCARSRAIRVVPLKYGLAMTCVNRAAAGRRYDDRVRRALASAKRARRACRPVQLRLSARGTSGGRRPEMPSWSRFTCHGYRRPKSGVVYVARRTDTSMLPGILGTLTIRGAAMAGRARGGGGVATLGAASGFCGHARPLTPWRCTGESWRAGGLVSALPISAP